MFVNVLVGTNTHCVSAIAFNTYNFNNVITAVITFPTWNVSNYLPMVENDGITITVDSKESKIYIDLSKADVNIYRM